MILKIVSHAITAALLVRVQVIMNVILALLVTIEEPTLTIHSLEE